MDEKNEILIIDDDEGTRKTLTFILKKKGFDVITAGTGEEGLKQAQGRKIAVALLDINLPDIEGIQLIAPLKEMHPGLSVIMITGFASMENAMRALNEGAAGYVLKPVKIDEILAKIQDAFERQSLIRNKELAEEALRASENRYRTLFEESPISLWEEDFSGLKSWIDTKKQEGVMDLASWFAEHPEEVAQCATMVKIIHINRATMTLFGAASFKEFIEGLNTIFPKESHDAFRDEIIALFTGSKEFEKETPLRTLTGERKIVIIKVTVVPGYEQTFSKIFVSGMDITPRKNVEEALHQANNKLNMLSSITRHDILNMIMAIRGYLELSEDLVDNPELKEYMKKENEAVDSIQRQIEFTRYYQDIGLEEPKWQDPGEIVRTVSQQLNLAGITLENSLSGLEIFADPLIEKVFYNLVENSLRHGEHVTTIGFSYTETGTGLTISYRDNGVGITDADKKKLFQKGFGKHTGLGLFLSREILSINGITIQENGEPGKGVNFEISVPEDGYRIKDTT